jgi:adenine-specific DNA-methyltransferase
MSSSLHGRLELTWTNKDEALLWEEDGSYKWVPPSDYRVAEVRLLHEAGVVGEVHPEAERAEDNLLIRGDALNALTSLAKLPEFQREYLGKVKLAYLDPPFNTQQAFAQYDDALEHSVWLTMMRDRFVQVRRLLAQDGSIWVHLDDAEMAHCRVVLDEVFGRENFLATVIWQRRYDPRNTAPNLSIDHDYILVFAKDVGSAHLNQLARSETMNAAYTNPDNDPRGAWRRGDLAARNFYSLGLYAITTPSGRVIAGPPSGSYWRVSESRLRELAADNRIYWGPDGKSRPYVKRFLTEVAAGRVPGSVWTPDEVGFVRNGKEEVRRLMDGREPFATPKPERLLQRVVEIATNPGDIVLDCFLGSGTTTAVAQKLNRRWIGVERSEQTLADFALPRLEKVVKGEDPGGITKAAGWAGGGAFRILDVAPSMFQEDGGTVVLADWAIGGELAQATAAQLGFRYADESPFAGTKGRTRLAVIDGLVNGDVVRLLAASLGPNERMTICGTAVDPDAETVAAEVSPGSRVRKIPASILTEYRQRGRRVFRPQPVPVEVGA